MFELFYGIYDLMLGHAD